MATRNEIISALARERRVEELVRKIARKGRDADMDDLAQMVYLALLEYDEEKLQDLRDNGQMNYFLARVIVNQCRSNHSPFYHQIVKYQRRAKSLDAVRNKPDE